MVIKGKSYLIQKLKKESFSSLITMSQTTVPFVVFEFPINIPTLTCLRLQLLRLWHRHTSEIS